MMLESQQNIEKLQGYLASYEIEAAVEQLHLLLRHLDLVAEKNKVMNLTRITDDNDAMIRHIVDSLILLPTFQRYGFGEETSFLDIGTGAGFPGIPLAIMSGAQGTLIDSVGKKAKAVQEFLQRLELDGQVQTSTLRAEELGRDHTKKFDFVTARAVAELSTLVEYASPLLKRGGHLIVSKAQISDEEVSDGIETAKIVGMTYVSRETFELPEDSGHREILTFESTHRSRVKLPRQPGMAKHKPLVQRKEK